MHTNQASIKLRSKIDGQCTRVSNNLKDTLRSEYGCLLPIHAMLERIKMINCEDVLKMQLKGKNNNEELAIVIETSTKQKHKIINRKQSESEAQSTGEKRIQNVEDLELRSYNLLDYMVASDDLMIDYDSLL